MNKLNQEKFSQRFKTFTRLITGFFIITLVMLCAGLIVILQSKERAYEDIAITNLNINEDTTAPVFPVGINPRLQTITELEEVEDFFNNEVAQITPSRDNFWQSLTAFLVNFNWYQNLASAGTRILVIWPGERKEQVIKNFSDILDWTKDEEEIFEILVTHSKPLQEEGKFFPGTYVVPRGSDPETVALLVNNQFKNEILNRYPDNIEQVISLEEALIIASMLEREAYDFTDMRIISGVIWNRLFIDMPLQLDATLQYAKGSSPYERKWWPQVKPRDKYIDSLYNTYENKGLPPGPIANPSSESILAALNPRQTDCLFYFHDSNSGFHCSPTYEGHVELLKIHYGQGR